MPFDNPQTPRGEPSRQDVGFEFEFMCLWHYFVAISESRVELGTLFLKQTGISGFKRGVKVCSLIEATPRSRSLHQRCKETERQSGHRQSQ